MPKNIAPFFAIYGEPTQPAAADFLHIERVRDRVHLHDGHVETHRHASLHQFCLWQGAPAQYVLDGQTFELSPPCLTSVPPNVPHGFTLGSSTNAIVVSTSGTFLAKATHGLPQLQIGPIFREPRAIPLSTDSAARLAQQFEALEGAYGRPSWTQAHVIEARLRLLVLEIAEIMEVVPAHREGSFRAALINRFLDLIDEQFRDRWTIVQYAKELGVTRYQLNAATLDALKHTPASLVRLRNVQEAKRLLLYTALSVAEVGYALGYKDPAHFGRSFRQLTGRSPAAWRRANLTTSVVQ